MARMPPFRQALPLYAFGASATATLVLALGVSSRALMLEGFAAMGYYGILGSFLLWFGVLLTHHPHWAELRRLCFAHWPALALAAALVVGAFFASPPRFRILADETELLSAAMGLYDAHVPRKAAELVYRFGGFQDLVDYGYGKRPLAFPFLIYVAHAVLGYHAEINAFVVNGVCGFGLLVAFYALLDRHLSRFSAWLGMALLGAFPLVVLCMTSGGFEIANLFFGMLVLLAFDRLLQWRSGRAASVLLATALVAAQVRYESAIFALAVVPWIVFLLPRGEWFRLGWSVVPVPLLLVPAVWQRRINLDSAVFEVHNGGPVFAWRYVGHNLSRAFEFFTAGREAYGTIGPLFWLASLGFVVWAVRGLRRPKALRSRPGVLASVAIGVAVLHLAVLMAYYSGDLTLQIALRLGLVFIPFVVVLALVVLRTFLGEGRVAQTAMTVGALGLVLHYWPIAGRNEATREIVVYREFTGVLEFLQQRYPDKNVLLITDFSHLYVPFRYGALKFERVRQNPEGLAHRMRQAQAKEVVAVQRVDVQTGEAVQATALGPRFQLKTLAECGLSITYKLRFARVERISSRGGA